MNTISFMSANFVARQLDYNMTEGWGQGDRATNAYFRPLDTYAERFAAILADVQALGFEAIDLWNAHLHWSWATDEHVAIARELLAQHGLQVVSMAGDFGDSDDELEAACRLARALDIDLLGGVCNLVVRDRPLALLILQEHGVRLGFENHPEKTPQELLDKIDGGVEGVLGVTVDTGWFGTQGYDAARALEELREHLMHVHLKDVLEPGAHETCRYGEGCVPIEECVHVLQRIGYRGGISVEHEPERFDPIEDCRANLAMLRAWLG